MNRPLSRFGFTIIELVIVVSIISLLATILVMNFNESRMSARDDARKASLSQLQVALELYKAQHGRYPAMGCGGTNTVVRWIGPGPHSVSWANNNHCAEYIVGLAPEFIPELPTDPKYEYEDNRGFLYRTDAQRTAYKLIVFDTVESQSINDFSDDFARCPRPSPSVFQGCHSMVFPSDTYAIYSAGAEDW